MTQELWSRVDAYLEDYFVPEDPALTQALEASAVAGLPTIQITAMQGKLLQLLAQMQNARRILEIGTLGGYSTIWLARALPDQGMLITLEVNPHHAAVAQANIAQAGLTHRVTVRVGNALDTLPLLAEEGLAPFDLIFIDADKPGYADYLAWSLKLARPGTVLIFDNVIRAGKVADPDNTEENVLGVRRLFDRMAHTPQLAVAAIQMVGSKGYDGFVVARVL